MKTDKKNKIILLWAIISAVLILSFVLFGINSGNYGYFLSRRIPKVLAIVITAVATAFSSVVFQTVTNNRILTPSALGLDSLYLMVQTIIVFAFNSSSIFVVDKNINFIISVILMLLFSSILYKFIFNKERVNIITLMLTGMVFGTLFHSLSSFMQMVIDPNEFLLVQDKMFASFNNVNTNIIYISLWAVAFAVIFIYMKSDILDVMSLGREQSINLGINHEKMMKSMLVMVSVLVSVAIALVGPITFLGILCANLSREILKTYEHRYLFAGSSLIGITALVGGQFMVERLFNFSTPISVIINFVGGLYFIQLLVKENAA